jgi:hypothetical protein
MGGWTTTLGCTSTVPTDGLTVDEPIDGSTEGVTEADLRLKGLAEGTA